MEESETHPEAPLSRTNGGEQASANRRFAEIQQAALRGRINAKRVNGYATDGRLEGLPAGQVRFCLPLLGRFYLVRVGPAAKAADKNADTDARVRVMLLTANVVIGFIAAVAAAVYAISGDAPFVYMARETGFFLLRQISIVRDLIGGFLSFSLF